MKKLLLSAALLALCVANIQSMNLGNYADSEEVAQNKSQILQQQLSAQDKRIRQLEEQIREIAKLKKTPVVKEVEPIKDRGVVIPKRQVKPQKVHYTCPSAYGEKA